MIGKIIDNYKIIQHIGTGGMGTVYLAEDIMLGRKIAIKMLHSELLYKKDILERFKAEAKTLAKLNHPNIAILFNLIESSGNYFMIMEYVDGNSLEKLLIENGAVEANKAIDITIQALEGIEHAHHKKIIHRDLKPANLMLNEEEVVKVMDFGIARALGSARMTREGSVVGTLEYMAPEQIRGQEGDERSDIYAMGIVLYELLTGNVPYRSKSDYDLMTKKLTQKPPEIRSFWHEIPKSLEKVVM
ncbi:MAG TPA: serine/threonine protein kinase, partial [Bacteroidetes bacterium]|nr:serine/threonine protein kinase [Bacteroidota bacterium]